MLSGYLAILALTILGVIVGLQFWLGPTFKNQKAFRWSGTAIAFAIALFLAGSGVIRLSAEIATRSWPVVEGTITQSRVVGQRAIHPEITYDYMVGGKEYSNVSLLRTPGFGNKRSRLETAELIVSKYQAGMPVTVHYDPGHPGESTIKVGISYGSSLETTFGSLLLLVLIFVALPLMRKAGKTANEPPAVAGQSIQK